MVSSSSFDLTLLMTRHTHCLLDKAAIIVRTKKPQENVNNSKNSLQNLHKRKKNNFFLNMYFNLGHFDLEDLRK